MTSAHKKGRLPTTAGQAALSEDATAKHSVRDGVDERRCVQNPCNIGEPCWLDLRSGVAWNLDDG